MKRVLVVALAVTGVENLSAGQSYKVKEGDSLSKIVQSHFPERRIYGKEGTLKKIVTGNPQVSDPEVIFPDQEIYLSELNDRVAIPAASKPVTIPAPKSTPRKLTNNPGSRIKRRHWNSSAHLGVKFVSLTQTGVLGSANLGVLFLNHLSLVSEYRNKNWGAWLKYEHYQFNYEALASSGGEGLNAFHLGGAYRWLHAGFSLEQSPLFKNNAGTVILTSRRTLSAGVGASKHVALNANRSMAVRLRSWVSFPVLSSTPRTEVSTHSVRGVGISNQGALTRHVLSRKDYSLHLSWITTVGFQKLSSKVVWGASEGSVASTMFDAATSVGMLIDF